MKTSGVWSLKFEGETEFKEVAIEFDTQDPCQICGLPVEEGSVSGPGSCGFCDVGLFRDGSSWAGWFPYGTDQQNPLKWERFKKEAKIRLDNIKPI